jgi:GTPase SAR1 family protein
MFSLLNSLIFSPSTTNNHPTNNNNNNKTNTTRPIERGRRRDVLIISPPHAGKTTLIYKLKTGNCLEFPPTTRNFILMEEIRIEGVDGSFRCMEGLNHLFSSSSSGESSNMGMITALRNRDDLIGILFLVDGTDLSKLSDARQMLHQFINDRNWAHLYIAIIFNKSDRVRDFLPIETISQGLNLEILHPSRFQVFMNTSTDGIGAASALAWLATKRENVETLREFKGLLLRESNSLLQEQSNEQRKQE